MFLFLTFLPPWLQITLGIFTTLGGTSSIIAWFKARKERQEFIIAQARREEQEKAALEARVKDYNLFQQKVEERMTGFNVALEKVGDKAADDCRVLEAKITSLNHLSTDVTKLQATTDSTNNRVEKLEDSLEKVEARLNTKLDSLDKKVDDNARWQNSVLNEILLHLNGGGRKLPNPLN